MLFICLFVGLVWFAGLFLWDIVLGLNSTVRAAKGKWTLSQSDPVQVFVGFFMTGNL